MGDLLTRGAFFGSLKQFLFVRNFLCGLQGACFALHAIPTDPNSPSLLLLSPGLHVSIYHSYLPPTLDNLCCRTTTMLSEASKDLGWLVF